MQAAHPPPPCGLVRHEELRPLALPRHAVAVAQLGRVRGQPFELLCYRPLPDVRDVNASWTRPLAAGVGGERVGGVVPLEIDDRVQVHDDHAIPLHIQGAGIDAPQPVNQVALGRPAKKVGVHQIDLDHPSPSRAALDPPRPHGARAPLTAEFLDRRRDLGGRVVREPHDLDGHDHGYPPQAVTRRARHRQVGRLHVLPPLLDVHVGGSDGRDRAQPRVVGAARFFRVGHYLGDAGVRLERSEEVTSVPH